MNACGMDWIWRANRPGMGHDYSLSVTTLSTSNTDISCPLVPNLHLIVNTN